MNNDIVQTSKLPRAIAKEKDGVILYWVEELGIAGLHQAALCRLFNCSEDIAKRILATISSGKDEWVLEAEIVTEKGLRVVRLLSESGFTKFARLICTSKAKESSKDTAWDLIEKFAAAGFKLMVMLQLAPQELAARAVEHAAKNDRLRELELENEILTRKERLAVLTGTLVTMHGAELGLTIAGMKDVSVIETKIPITEVLNPVNGKSQEFLSAPQLASEIKRRTGQNIKNGDFIKKLKAANRDDLILPVTRNATCEYVTLDSLNEAMSVVFGNSKQTLLGINNSQN